MKITSPVRSSAPVRCKELGFIIRNAPVPAYLALDVPNLVSARFRHLPAKEAASLVQFVCPPPAPTAARNLRGCISVALGLQQSAGGSLLALLDVALVQ